MRGEEVPPASSEQRERRAARRRPAMRSAASTEGRPHSSSLGERPAARSYAAAATRTRSLARPSARLRSEDDAPRQGRRWPRPDATRAGRCLGPGAPRRGCMRAPSSARGIGIHAARASGCVNSISRAPTERAPPPRRRRGRRCPLRSTRRARDQSRATRRSPRRHENASLRLGHLTEPAQERSAMSSRWGSARFSAAQQPSRLRGGSSSARGLPPVELNRRSTDPWRSPGRRAVPPRPDGRARPSQRRRSRRPATTHALTYREHERDRVCDSRRAANRASRRSMV